VPGKTEVKTKQMVNGGRRNICILVNFEDGSQNERRKESRSRVGVDRAVTKE
jgi:hypothetical protein